MSSRVAKVYQFSVALATAHHRRASLFRPAFAYFSSVRLEKQSPRRHRRRRPRKRVDKAQVPVQSSTDNLLQAPRRTTECSGNLNGIIQQRTPEEERRYRVVVQAVSPWLRRDPDWQEETVKSLRLPKSSASRKKNSPVILWDGSYHHLYKDSLPSFLEVLEVNPPPELHSALDKLAKTGFDHPSFAKDYARRQIHREDDRLSVGKIIAKKAEAGRNLAQRQKKRNRTSRQIQQMTAQHADLTVKQEAKKTKEERQNANPDHSSLWEETVRTLSSWLFPSSDREDRPLQQIDPLSVSNKESRKILSLEKKIQRKQRELEQQEQSVLVLGMKLDKLNLEHEMLSSHLDLDSDDATHDAMRNARNDICSTFADHIEIRHSKMLEKYKDLDQKTDLTKPYEWFPLARRGRRKIIFHGGPTNSGKTHSALERLKEAKRGVYLGPLRLLAAEIYERLTNAGVDCNLLTGQERREVPFATHTAATIEMASLEHKYDVAVIDEVQMLADEERGFAWTRALMGVRSKEIHVCGGHEAEQIVRRIAKACGDQFENQHYERFTDLRVASSSLAYYEEENGSYISVQPGDCVVAFSRDDIFAIKREIENTTGYRCCVIYGSLPPQTRAEQARLFNDPNSDYDILVASDAIGMGLNLSIRRIVFNSIFKNDGTGIVRLDHCAMKQISGRAGRRNSPFPDGEVTCRDPRDMPHLRKCMATDIIAITRAGLLPTESHIELFHDALEQYGLDTGDSDNDLHQILLLFNDMATVKSDYFLCRQTPMVTIAKQVAALDLPLRDKYTLCMSPVNLNSKSSMDVLMRFATNLANGEAAVLDSLAVPRGTKTFDDLARLCSVFNELELFLWLQKKFQPEHAAEEQDALARKEEIVELIGEALAETDKLKQDHCYISRDRRLRRVWENTRDRNGFSDTLWK